MVVRMAGSKDTSQCPFCARETHLTLHHYIPRKVHRRTHFKKHYSKQTLAKGIRICRQCHRGVHKFYDEMYLAKHLNSSELLCADDALATHFAWVAKQRVRLG